MIPFSILDIGRRINALSIETDVLAEAQAELAEHSFEYQKNAADLDRWADERETLQKLALTCNPRTPEEACVQLALVFYAVGTMLENESAEPVHAELKAIQRAMAGVTRVVADRAHVDLNQFGESDLVYRMDLRCPVTPAGRTTA